MVTDDFTHLAEPKTNREVLQSIVHMIQEDRDDRQEDRELLEKFITEQAEFNKVMDERLKLMEKCSIQHGESINTLKEQSKKWDITNTIGILIAALLAALGIKN